MGKAEELLDSLDVTDPDLLIPVDGDEHIVIDANRNIKVPDKLKRIAVQYDHNMDSVTFDCPRYSDGIDMSKMKIFINYIRIDGELGSHYADDVTVDEDDSNIIHFSWKIDRHVSELAGSLQILVCAKYTDKNGDISNLWNTELSSDMYVSKGMETTVNVITQYPDLVTQILLRLETTATYTPKVSADGVISWTNDQGLPNPDPIDLTGPRGEKGETGATYTPKVSADGVISWTNDRQLGNPKPVNITGPQGVKGDTGSAIKTLNTSYSYTQGDLEKYSSNSYSGTWNVDSSDGVKIGDTVLLKIQNTTKGGHSLIVATVTKIPTATSITASSIGLIDKGEPGPRGEKGDLTSSIVASFALQRNKKVYTVKFPLWETSQSSIGEKLDDNESLICLPSTAAEHAQNDYENIPLFRTYDCNAHVTDDGERLVDALAGDKDFKDTGKNDVFVLGMLYYEKSWIENGYWYYSRNALPKEGYTLAKECETPDGRDQGFAVYGKYVCGLLDGILYSSKGLVPARQCEGNKNAGNIYISYNNNINYFKKKGKYYTGGLLCDYKYILSSFWLMFATINSQSVMAGVTNWSAQCRNLVAETGTNRVIVTKQQANTFEVGCYVSIGDNGSTTAASDRVYWETHNLAECVKVVSKEAIDDNNTAIIVDATFDSTLSTWITTFHWRSGFSDDVKGRTGCPCYEKSGLTNGKYPIVLQVIEMMVGGYEVGANAIMDIVDAAGTREVYITNDATKLTSDISKIKQTYTMLVESIHASNLNSWNYITAMYLDLINGAIIPSHSGEKNSGSNTGFADGLYVDGETSGQREWLFFGNLRYGSISGLSCLAASFGLGGPWWYILSRLSINAVG